MQQGRFVIPFSKLRMSDVEIVGGKNASLGELLSQLTEAGIRVPDGFATTAEAFRVFLKEGGLDKRIEERLKTLDVDDVKELAKAGAEIRQWIEEAPFPAQLEKEIREHYEWLKGDQEQISVAVRSSATAEDLPDASFAGQQETFLNVVGIDQVFARMKEVFASLYNDRAISYRVHKGFDHSVVALSAGVQRMVRSDKGCAGVMFTMDTESGFDQVVFITASYGLGETVVQGAVNPDEYFVHKPMLEQGNFPIIRKVLGSKKIEMVFDTDKASGRSVKVVDVPEAERKKFALNDNEIIELAKYARIIEKHYGRPMDIEWGKDGIDGKLYILQARPETVKSRQKSQDVQEKFVLLGKGEVLVTGRAIGQKIGSGKVKIVDGPEQMHLVQEGDILVTDMTDPNWEPVMKKASAIVTNRGGRTCHAAIIARELGIAAVVGCGNATEILKDDQEVTVSCAEGDTGYIYNGLVPYEIKEVKQGELPECPVKIMMNVGNPQLAFEFQSIPNKGVGLARLEFIINNNIGIHPKACLDYPNLPEDLKKAVEEATFAAGAREVHLIEEPVAAAIGAGIDISKPCGNMIVDIGGGTADIAVISLGGTVVNTSIKVAGDDFDEAIVRYMRKKHNLLIGERTAEDIKIKIGTTYPLAEEEKMEVRGRNLVTGLPKTVTVTSSETEEALRECTGQIVEAVVSVLEQTPPELSADILDRGIVLTGGGSLLRGLEELIEEKTGINTMTAEDPMKVVAIGTGEFVEFMSGRKDY